MDENKRKKLQKIGYKFQACCGMCVHGKFRPNNMFGDCQLHTYSHLKHSAESKPLSINLFGYCESYEFNEKLYSQIHGFVEFLEK